MLRERQQRRQPDGEGAGSDRWAAHGAGADDAEGDWEPPILETVATDGEGVENLVEVLEDHVAYLDASGERSLRRRERQADTIRRILRARTRSLVTVELDADGGVDALAEQVLAGESDPYSIAAGVMDPIEDCLDGK
jgi:LAO/AO transport system kinase